MAGVQQFTSHLGCKIILAPTGNDLFPAGSALLILRIDTRRAEVLLTADEQERLAEMLLAGLEERG